MRPTRDPRRPAARARQRFLAATFAFFAMLACFVPGAAHAHPDLDRGKRLAADLEFEPALLAFESAIATGTLTRDELVELLSERALLLHGMRRQKELLSDFIWLSALAPNHRLDLRAAPELVAMWTSTRDQGRGAVAIELEAATSSSNGQPILEAHAKLVGTVPDGTHARISLRANDGLWRTDDSIRLRAPAIAGKGYELYAEAVGLGGLVVARAYAPDAPLRITAATNQAVSTAAEDTPADRHDGSPRKRRAWLVGSAVVLAGVAAAVTVVLLKRQTDDSRAPTTLKPMARF